MEMAARLYHAYPQVVVFKKMEGLVTACTLNSLASEDYGRMVHRVTLVAEAHDVSMLLRGLARRHDIVHFARKLVYPTATDVDIGVFGQPRHLLLKAIWFANVVSVHTCHDVVATVFQAFVQCAT